MTTITRRLGKILRSRAEVRAAVVEEPGAQDEFPPFDIAPDDPLLAALAASPGAVRLDQMELDSPALRSMREAGVEVVVPLVSQGELIGLLNLGQRLSQRDYSSDDRRLLEELATNAAPAIRVAQLVREQEAQAGERERVQQELRVATLIQQQFLPTELPELPGWQVAAYYQPAREVGGDFYDFVELPGGLVGMIVGDVTDKGVPAALVMATTHSLMRAEAPRLVSPSAVLERVNELLVEEMPPDMFVTCLYVVLEPGTGKLRIANAGHNPPFVATSLGSVALRARGLPLGLMPGMTYEEIEATLCPGDGMLLHSDGLVEAHDPGRDMFGFPRLLALVGRRLDGQVLIDVLLQELRRFTGDGWVQEDDITLVALNRGSHVGEGSRLLAGFAVPSAPGNERVARDRVAAALGTHAIPAERLERLKTAVAEATMNAIEHGNQSRPELPVEVRLYASDTAVRVLITDQGGDRAIPEVDVPDIEAKLTGLQPPRGWGLFLIRSMVDSVKQSIEGERHTIELVLRTEGESNASQPI
jgi:serine phosphatase RsbU (regulator of sigma subunit)/anti-sigma regulatory factor (Ser/Thr protein kinase)